MSDYDDLVAAADAERAAGRYKEASIAYGRVLAVGGPLDGRCRHLRGACARRVGEQRLDKAKDHPEARNAYLDQAARWLTKAEAFLDSALDEASGEEWVEVRIEQARTEEALARYLTMCGVDPSRRLGEAERHRREAADGPARSTV